MLRFGGINSIARYTLSLTLAALAASASACLYGFNGGGLPGHVKTIAVVPFDNETPVADLQRELSDSLRSRLANRLGLRPASEAKANAVVHGTIRRYTADIPIGYDANQRTATTARRSLEMVLDVDIVDQVTGKTLWSRKAYTVEGQYDEQQELLGRSQALDRLVNAIVEGAQSQW
jgi:hypothetical protein